MQAAVTQPVRQAPTAEDLEVSVVMPCLNEARTVGRCVEKARNCLLRMGVRGEVVVADNGSTDGSPDIARAHGALVVAVKGRGYGCALQGGITAARGRFVIMGDADDSYDFGKLEPFVWRLREGYELVMGNRFRGGILPGAMPRLHRYLGNPVLSGLLNLFFRTPIGDAHCGLRAFRKDAYERLGLTTPGMEFASEMVVKSALRRQKITEVPVVLHPDGRDRPPHLRSFRDGWRHLRFLLLFCPLWLYLIPAVLLAGAGLGLMAWLTSATVVNVPGLLLGAAGVVLGYQGLWHWTFARAHSRASGLVPAERCPRRGLERLSLERGLIFGASLAVAGGALTLWLAGQWSEGDLHVSTLLRPALWGFTALALGLQTMFGSFFLSMLGMGSSAPMTNPE
jgi:hypothetical protein